jgi:hypothetical protein
MDRAWAWARSVKEAQGPCSISVEDDLQLLFASSERCVGSKGKKRVFGYRTRMNLSHMRKFRDQNDHFRSLGMKLSRLRKFED